MWESLLSNMISEHYFEHLNEKVGIIGEVERRRCVNWEEHSRTIDRRWDATDSSYILGNPNILGKRQKKKTSIMGKHG